jgi:hypothetical protein
MSYARSQPSGVVHDTRTVYPLSLSLSLSLSLLSRSHPPFYIARRGSLRCSLQGILAGEAVRWSKLGAKARALSDMLSGLPGGIVRVPSLGLPCYGGNLPSCSSNIYQYSPRLWKPTHLLPSCPRSWKPAHLLVGLGVLRAAVDTRGEGGGEARRAATITVTQAGRGGGRTVVAATRGAHRLPNLKVGWRRVERRLMRELGLGGEV